MASKSNHFLYFLHTADYRYFKYGHSGNVERRIGQLNTGSPYRWQLYQKIEVDSDYAKQAEKKIKDLLRGRYKNKFGEVSDTPKKTIDWIIFEVKTKWKELYPEWRIENDNQE